MASREKRIIILDCCGERFSKIVDHWMDEPMVGEKLFLEIYAGLGWGVMVYEFLPKNTDVNNRSLDVVFVESDDENLFLCLCEAIGEEGWFEQEGVLEELTS